jgi:hypothetical protein
MKHERMPTRWRLKKTLARRVDFRPIERDDMKYAYAAYKKGRMASMGERWAGGELTPSEFAEAFEVEIQTVYHGVWVLLAEGSKGYIPAGMVMGFWSHPDPRFAPFMIVGDIIWFPWASARNRIESAVGFFARIRSEIAMVEYASEEHKRFFEMICQHGIMRRVGTSFNVYPGQATAVYETRAP